MLHGTTVGTNALLERQGARVLLVATEGFEDVLELGRQARPRLYDLAVAARPSLVAPGDAIGVRERLEPDGSVHLPLDPAAIDALLEAIAQRLDEPGPPRHDASVSASAGAPSAAVRSGAQRSAAPDEAPTAVAICLLHAYANDAHERVLLDAIRQRFGARLATVCCSSEVLAELREYERASTTTANAFIAPRVARYVERLEARLAGLEVAAGARLRIMQSNGGLMSAAEAAAYPVQTALSGPAGGVLGGLASARAAGFERVVTFDMGGTSSDVGFCDGRVGLGTEGHVGELPVRIPMVDLHTVGAGGGSLARIDAGGALKVGPASAGALPGPACYGRGGVLPTVSDAHVVLGRLCPERFLGGAMALDVEAARRAVHDVIAAPLGLSLEQAAAGILEVIDAAMARALRVMSVERGQVPERLALVAFGGAGALHACSLADALGIPTVLVPARPGLLSAYGMLHADIVRFASRSVVCELGRDGATVPPREALGRTIATVAALSARCHALLEHDGVGLAARALAPEAEVRYRGQSFELTVPLAPGLVDAALQADEGAVAAELTRLRAAFAAAHELRYGYRMAERAVELVTLRVRGTGRVPRVASAAAMAQLEEALPSSPYQAWFDGHWQAVALHERAALAPGGAVRGPAIITEYTATTVVAPGWTARLEASGALVLER